jgi:hypothetical protein
MAIWTQIFLISNAIYWAIFFYLLSRRRWDRAAFTVGLFHMLLASVLSVAPFRSLLDPAYRWQLGFVGCGGRVAAIPAFLTLGWTLAAAWLAVAKGAGGSMWVIAVGDLFFALNLAAAILLFPLRGNLAYQKVQLGEKFIVTGWMASLILLLGFVAPPIASCIWAARRSRRLFKSGVEWSSPSRA